MISSPHNAGSRCRSPRGFTITELMIAMTLGAIVLVGVLTTFLMLVRSGIRLSNYSVMETQTRRAFEQLGIDVRMANNFTANFTGGQITSITLTIPSSDLSTIRQVTYGYDTTDSSDGKFFSVPGNDPAATTGRLDLITNVSSLTVTRYDRNDTEIPPGTTSSAGIKHLQVSVSVTRSGVGVAAATQVIRSSAFTIRNITL